MKATEGSIVEENKKALHFIEEVTTNVDEVQKRVLAEILSQNANVEYLQRHDLNGHTDRETFKKVMPVITYEDIQPDINRIANGDKSPIFCFQSTSEFLTRFVFSRCASPSQWCMIIKYTIHILCISLTCSRSCICILCL